MKYVSVCKALYDYKATSDEELTFNEDNILYILDKDDDPDWWKAQLKAASLDQVGPIGLVPANYIDEAEPIGKVEALYDYSAQQDEELSFKEGDIMVLYENDDPDWFIVKGKDGSIGLVPSNYIQEISNKAVTPAAPAAVPEQPPTTQDAQQPSVSVFSAISNSPPMEKPRVDDEAVSWSVHEYDVDKKKKKKSKGNLLIGNGMLCYGSETDKASPVRQFSISDVGHSTQDGKNVHIEISDAARTMLDFQAASKSEAKAVVAKIEESKSIAGPPPTPQQPVASSPLVAPAAPAQPEQPACEPRWAIVLYDFNADGPEELSVRENDQVLAVDYVGSDEWWTVEYQDGRSGIVPASYVQFQEDYEADLEREQRQKEEEDERQRREAEAAAARQRRLEEEEARRRQEEQRRRQEEQAKREEAEKRRQEQEAKRLAAAAAAGSPRRSQIPAPPPPNKPPAGRAMPSAQAVKSIPTPNNRSLPDRPKQAQDPGKPDPAKVRTWTDRSGAFKVEAQFLTCHNDKIRLHKINGVKIDVPVQKMCQEDLRYIEQETGQRLLEDNTDDIPLAHFASKDNRKQFDWYDYFMKANIPMNNSLRYASTFQAEGLGQKDLENLTHRKMKSLGMSESHVQRLQRFIETNVPEPASDEETVAPPKKKKSVSFGATSVIDDSEDESWQQPRHVQSQIEQDERLARQLQEQFNSQSQQQEESPVFNRGGNLHRRGTGRPTPNHAAPRGVNTAMMDKIKTQLSTTPLQPTPVAKPSPPATPPRDPVPQQPPALPAPPVNGTNQPTGFSDDAWAPRAVSSPSNPPAQTGDAMAQTKAAWSAAPPPPPPLQQPIQTPPPSQQPSQPPVPLPPRQRPTPTTSQNKVDPQMLSQWTNPAGTPQQQPIQQQPIQQQSIQQQPIQQQPIQQQPIQQQPIQQQQSHVQQMAMQFGTQQAPPPPPRSPMNQFVQPTPPPAQSQFMQAPTQNPAFAAHSPVQQNQFIPQHQQMMNVPVNAALQQPLVPMATGMSSQSSQSSEGRTWANATPDNPFGSGGGPAQRPPLQQQGSFSMGSSSSLQPSQVFASMTGQAGFQQQQPTGFGQPMQNHDPNDKYSVFKNMNAGSPSVFAQGQPQPGFQQPQQTGFGQPAFGQNAFGQPQQQQQQFYNRW
ncbi:hypothetical protein BJV82DRAFT_597590 [Fennellomyces sp. T-0311]|nr:hypothetical protein BJV82DRAFT_597590 [Fennellomyces sp. T-0311]